MDENYLDSLLNEVSLDKELDHKIEEELDSQIQKEKRQYQEQQLISDEDLFNMDLELDAGDLRAEKDVHFSEEQMDELDRLDNLADLDIGDLDFSDIDFDDLDVTKLDDVEADELDDLLKEFEGDLDIANLFELEKDDSSVAMRDSDEITVSINDELVDDTLLSETDDTVEQKADLNEDSFDADEFLDSLLDDTTTSDRDTGEGAVADISALQSVSEDNSVEEEASDSMNSDEDLDLLQALEEFGGFEETPKQEEPASQLSDTDNAELDDILSMLNLSMEESESAPEIKDTVSSLEDDLHDEFEDVEEISKPDKKQQFMEMLFGEPDEDDILSEEELAEIEAKKTAKKEKKKAAKKTKEEKSKVAKEEKAAKNSQKKKANQEKKMLKAQKKARLRAQELANAEPEKKLNRPMVVFIFTLFLGGIFLFFMATNNFNYAQAIERATNYFANQKYRKAYDEIVGIEVKEKDEELKERIYTVMYVERLYESYQNNIELGRQEKALDSLLRGVAKYYEHYEEAETLGVTSDMDYSFNQIETVLKNQYGITVEEATEINKMSNYDYVQYIQAVVEKQADNIIVPQENGSESEITVDSDDKDATVLTEEKKEEVEE